MGLQRISGRNFWDKAPLGALVVILISVLAVFIYTAVITYSLDSSVMDEKIQESAEHADAMERVLAGLLSAESFEDINSAADMEGELYTSLQTRLNETRNMNSTRYFYTAKRAQDGTVVYVVDGLDRDAEDFRCPGDPIEDEMVPYIEQALSGQTVYSQDIVDTTWGHIFTACYPVYDSASGQVVGALCIETDMEAAYAFTAQSKAMLMRMAGVAALVLAALVLCAYAFVHAARTREQRDRTELLASNVRLADSLERESEQVQIISAMATIYTTIFLVNLRDKTYEVMESVELMHGISGKRGEVGGAIEGILEAFISPDMHDEMRAFLDLDTMPERLRDKNTVMIEYRDPAGRWFQGRLIVRKRDEAGEVTDVIYVARDFTDEKKRETDLREQLRDTAVEARRASLSKTTFLRRMSHDIRTPLNGIIGMVRLSEDFADDPVKSREIREKILHSADYLLDLVNNVLDISKLESGALELEHKPFNLSEVLLKEVDVISVNAQEYGIRFEGGREESHLVHRRLVGSPVHLNRVLMNLASNAIKYNRPGGTVKVYVRETASDETSATYEFVCQDTGLGMSEEFQARAFEPFSQEGKQTMTSFSGSGLGLSIVREIVEMMGGTVSLTSEEGVGTTFLVSLTFDLDLTVQDATDGAVAQLPEVQLAGKRALLVEDNELNMEIARYLLQGEGFILEEATDGKAAVEAFAASEPGHFDYIFMDVMMPVMDGLEATRRIRALERADAASVKIVAMTANAFAEDRQACLEAGMDAHIGKPLDIVDIRRELARL